MRVFINGFGRIGRSVLRAYMGRPEAWPGMQIAGINDIAAPASSACQFSENAVTCRPARRAQRCDNGVQRPLDFSGCTGVMWVRRLEDVFHSSSVLGVAPNAIGRR